MINIRSYFRSEYDKFYMYIQKDKFLDMIIIFLGLAIIEIIEEFF
jgi:hypothetical protein